MDTSKMTDAEVEAEFAKHEAAQTPQQPTPAATVPTVQQEDPTVSSQPAPAERSTLADVGAGLVRGGEMAVRGVRETARAVQRAIVPEKFQDAGINDELTYGSSAPEGAVGKIAADLTRFALGFIGAGAAIKGAGLVAGAAKSAISSGVTSDPNAERLSNFLEEHPYLANPVTAYLATKPGDSVGESKFKAAVEDLGLSAVGGAIFQTFKKFKDGEFVEFMGRSAKDASQTQATAAAADVGLKLTPEHAATLAGELDSLLGRTYQGSEVAADAANPSLLNTAKMQTGDDVRATINRFGEVLGPVMKAQGWTEHQTHVETLNLADQLAANPDELLGSLRAMGHDASTIPQTVVAGRMLLQTQTTDLFTAAKKATITGEGKAEAIAKLDAVAKSLANLKMIVTGAARTTESGRIPVGEIDPERMAKWIAAQGGHDNVLQKIAMTEGDPTALAKLARSTDEVVQDAMDSAWKVHNTIWINGLLSSPKTQLVNAVSTGLNVLAQPLNLMVGGTIRRDWADVREGVAIYKGLGTFLGDSWTMAKKSLMTETQILGGNKIVEPGVAMIDSNAGWAQALRFPTRVLGASDEFFKQLSYRAKVSAQAAREGMDAVKSGKIGQHELDGFIADKFKAAFDETTGAGLNEDALKFAEVSTFTQSLDRPTWLGNWAEGVSSLSSHPALRGTVLPFIRVPSNLLREVMDYTPVVGQLRKKFLTDMQAGGSQASESLGRMTVGTGLWVGAGMLALDGKITGAAMRDPDLAAQQRATGWQPYSFVINNADGTKSYISYNRLDPFASFLGLAADFAQIHGHLPEKKSEEWAAIASLSLSNNLMSKSYLKGILDTMSALAGSSPQRAETWIRQRVASYIPSIVGVAQPDTELKELRTWMDGAFAKVPGLSGTLEAKRDIFGQKVQAQAGYPQSGFNPFSVSKGNNDPVTKELARLATSDAQSQFSTPHENVGNVNLLDFRKPSGQTAYDRWLELSGQGLREAFQQRMQSTSYQNGSDGNSYYTASSRANMLREVQQRFQDRAMRQVQDEYPKLREALHADKQNKIDTKGGRAPRNPMADVLKFGAQ